MHLQDDLGVGAQQPRDAGLERDARLVGRDAAERRASRRALVAGVAAGRLRRRDDVMHDAAIAGLELNRLNPLVFGEVGRDADVLIRDRAVGRDLVRPRSS